MKDDKKFYYGTSSLNILGDYLTPSLKALAYNRKRVRITDNLTAAIFYADKAVLKLGGEPVVYEVKPKYSDLIRITKTDWNTTSAKILEKVPDSVIKEMRDNTNEVKN